MEKSFRAAIRVALIVAGICICCFLAIFLLPKFGIDWREHLFFLFYSVPAFLFCLFLLPFLFYYRKKYLSGAKELLDGNCLARWNYDNDEWNQFAETEWKRTQRSALWTPVGIVAGIVVLGYLFKGWTFDDYKIILPWVFALAVVGAFLIYYTGLNSYRKMLKKRGEVFIGESGLYFNDAYHTWNVFGARLGNVELIGDDPAILQFEILYTSRTGTRPSEIRVPVPRAHRKEAATIAAKLSAGKTSD